MALSDELKKPLPSFRPVLPAKPRIVRLAEESGRKWGEPGIVVLKDEDDNIINTVRRRLTANRGAMASLDRRQRKAIIQILWTLDPQWGEPVAFISRWLAWVDAEWRPALAVKRIWRHHLLRFDAESVTTPVLADWLCRRSEHLPQPYKAFSDRWQLFDTATAALVIADSLMTTNDFAMDVEALAIGRGTVRQSALMASILEVVGKRLLSGVNPPDPVRRVSVLIGDASGGLRQIEAPEPLRRRACGRLADGLVFWAIRRGDDLAEGRVLDLLLTLLGDPRLMPAAWDGVGEETVRQVEAWLSRKTLEVFFNIIDHLNTDAPHQWPHRKQFWERYLPYIKGAWLLCGPHAVPIADRMGVRYGRVTGPGVQGDHCALMLRIGGLTVVEMNKNAAAVFFDIGNVQAPIFYITDTPYSRARFGSHCNDRLSHNRSENMHWQSKFRDHIHDRTGIWIDLNDHRQGGRHG